MQLASDMSEQANQLHSLPEQMLEKKTPVCIPAYLGCVSQTCQMQNVVACHEMNGVLPYAFWLHQMRVQTGLHTSGLTQRALLSVRCYPGGHPTCHSKCMGDLVFVPYHTA